MTALLFRIQGPNTMSGRDLLLHLFGDVFAGQLLPAHIVTDSKPGAIREEVVLETAMATTYEGTPITFDWAQTPPNDENVAVWCAIVAQLPFGGTPVRQPWLRSGLPPRARPLVTAQVIDDAVHLRFGIEGAPLLPPPNAELIWAEAAQGAAREFGRSLRVALEGGAHIELTAEDLDRPQLESLIAALDAGPDLQVDITR